ncbi:dethiobiotin synthase [Salinibius halmophilus]|uniref:dethiobiotin synthase n=1 Tax=Salinibius halmophilus TaxID=1853216 RepID=UPI000E672CF5|nr:dethiobiotin synthase [Salinibius halmophilus]
MTKRYFITGTDTEVGKSFVTAALLARAAQQGRSAFGFKPIAAGATWHNGALENEDGQLLQQYSSPSYDYSVHNPIVFADPQSPHLCQATSLQSLINLSQQIPPADYQLIEGAGGWFVPINEQQTLADYANALNIPVILVVDIKLGCINHALLSAQAIGSKLAGWVANNRHGSNQNMIDSIATRLTAPCLGTLGQTTINHAATLIQFPDER